MERNEILVNLFSAAIVLVLAVALWFVFTDTREGLSVMDAGSGERVSRQYLTKSVKGDDTGRKIVWGGAGYENGSANIVTAIVVDYRIFDTLGEILVLMASAAGVGMLMDKNKKGKRSVREASPVVKTAVPIVALFALVLGGYIIVHGHLSPGGGFPGGAIMASAFMLSWLAGTKPPRAGIPKVAETLAGLVIIGFGIAGLFLEGSLFANFLPAGNLGSLFSAWSILILYTLIGIKVSAELSSVVSDFLEG